jgi:hypothetical protein
MEFTGIRLIYYRNPDAEFKIYDIADQHFTNRAVSWDHIHRDIDLIQRDPYSLWFEGGDFADWHLPSHPYFDAEAFDGDFKVSDLAKYASHVVGKIIDLYQPISNKCLGWCYGNHDHNYMTRSNQMGIQDSICDALNVQNMRYSGWCHMYFIPARNMNRPVKIVQSWEPPEHYRSFIRVFVHHGKGAAASVGGKMNSLRDVVNVVDADLVMTSHLHTQLAMPFVKISANENCTEPVAKTTMGLITGTYLRNYQPNHTGYGEKKAYAATTLGATRARYIPSERLMIVEQRADNVGIKGDL